MVLPIIKVKDIEGRSNLKSIEASDLSNLLPILNLQDIFAFPQDNENAKQSVYKIWSKSSSQGENEIKISSGDLSLDITRMVSKGYFIPTTKKNVLRITEKGRKIIKETILSDESSSFTKKASKELVSKNSYDFGDKILVKVKDPEKFGTRYISVELKTFAKKNLKPIKISSYNIKTKNEDGTYRDLKDYSDDELIRVLHLAKKIIKNASFLAKERTQYIPIHRISSFSEMILTELNKNRYFKKSQTIPDDGYLDGGRPYDDEQMEDINLIDEKNRIKREKIFKDKPFKETVYCTNDLNGTASGNIKIKFTKGAEYFAIRESYSYGVDNFVEMFFDAFNAIGSEEKREKNMIARIPYNIFIDYFDAEPLS